MAGEYGHWIRLATDDQQGWIVLILLAGFIVAFGYFIVTRLVSRNNEPVKKVVKDKSDRIFMIVTIIVMLVTMALFSIGLRRY